MRVVRDVGDVGGAMAGAMGHGLAGYMALTLPMFAIAYVALVGIGMSPRDVD